MSRIAPPRQPSFDADYIRDLSVKVYRLRLEQDCPGNVARMIAKDEDGGEKLRNRAGAYDALTRCYLKVLGFEPPLPMTAERAEELTRRAM